MKVLFMGTPAFAADSLRALLEAGHEVPAVVTRPDAPSGRGRALASSAVKILALERGLTVLQPAAMRSRALLDDLTVLAPDVVAVVAFGRLLPGAMLGLAKHGAVNVHASLLPRYRGAAPIAWAIARGEPETGVTTQRIVERLDAGDVLLQQATPIGARETAAELERRLASMGARLLVRTLDGLESGTVVPKPQDEALVTQAPLLRKEDGWIDWNADAQVIDCRVRAFDPWPVAHTRLRGGRGLRVWKVEPLGDDARGSDEPGTVLDTTAGAVVACGAGAVRLLEVQPEGRQRMPAQAAVAGRYLSPGDRLGSD
jgi:methionyl-tRNA formyltransferase